MGFAIGHWLQCPMSKLFINQKGDTMSNVNNDKFFKQYLTAVKGGQFVKVQMQKELKTKKAFAHHKIVKISEFVARSGVEYDNQKDVQAKRESGDLPSKNAGLPWGEWEVYPYSIKHKGARYLRFATAKTAKRTPAIYILDGVPVEADKVKEMCLASEFSRKDDLDVVAIKESNITGIIAGGVELTQ